MDLPRSFVIRESSHRILNPLTPQKLAVLGQALALPSGATLLDLRSLPDLIRLVQEHGWDPVEMVLADQDSWDRYQAAQWMNLRRFLDAHPEDELAGPLRERLTDDPVRYTTYERDYLGWGVLALMKR